MNASERALAQLTALPRLGAHPRLGVKAPPSSAPLKTRLAFLTRWGDALGAALGKMPPADVKKPVSPKNPRGGPRGPAAARLWTKIKSRFLRERDEYLKFVADPSLDVLDKLAGAPAELDQWEVTFAGFGRSIARLGGKAPDFQVGPGRAALVGPRMTKILSGIAADTRREAVAIAKRAGAAVKETVEERIAGIKETTSWIGWALAALGLGVTVYLGSRALTEARRANELAEARAEAEARRRAEERALAFEVGRESALQRQLEMAG